MLPVFLLWGQAPGWRFTLRGQAPGWRAMLYAWVACLAVLGGAKRWWNYKVEWMDWLSKKGFGIYVFHYLPLSIAGLYLTQHAQLPGVLVYVICGISSFAGALVMYEIVSRIPVLRWCLLGMRKKRE